MFVTSTLVAPGELGGLAGADTLCNQLATTGVQNGSPNSVAGTFSCTDWTTSVGTVSVATPNAVGPRFFGDNLGSSCSTPDNRLYCLE